MGRRLVATLRAVRLAVVVAASLGTTLPGCGADDSSDEWPALEPVVRPEHPRPDLRRDTFIDLNTVWDFAYDPDDVGVDERWFEPGHEDVWSDRIQVPYAWEAPLSGLVPPHTRPYFVGESLLANTYRGVAWYRLRLPDPLPSDPGMHWYLVFGAVDFRATVYVNGEHALDHVGGYDPFSVDLSPHVEPGERAEIVVRVEDLTELADRTQPVGKQGGVWYTRTSGIWQTVYLEQRPPLHLASYRVVPHPAEGTVAVKPVLSAESPASVSLDARLDGRVVGHAEAMLTGAGDEEITVDLDHVELWDVDHPTLYDLDIVVTGADGAADVVHGYFGLVTVRTDWVPGHSPDDTDDPLAQYRAVFVNDTPRYLRCVLDQSYYPDGVYTAPSVERMRQDLELARSFGFNCVRVHVKVDEPLVYRLADELGMFVLYDIPTLDIQTDNTPGFAGRAHVESTIRRAIERDASHPSILAWVLFNENWGLMEHGGLIEPTPIADSPSIQSWLHEMATLARELDPTRPIDDNSAGGVVGVYEHIDTDLNTFHQYSDDMAAFRELLQAQAEQVFVGSPASYVGGGVQDGAPWLNAEIGSYSAVGETEGVQAYCDLFGLVNEMRRQPKLVGYTVTQLTDVEYERNGLVAYDRSDKPDLCERAGVSLADVFTDDFAAFEWLPDAEVPAGTTVDVPLTVVRFSSTEPEDVEVAVAFGEDGAPATASLTAPAFEPASVTVSIPSPAEPGPAALVAELRGADGTVRSRNRLEVVVID